MKWVEFIARLAVLAAVSVVLIEPKLFSSTVMPRLFLRLAVLFWIVVEVGRFFVVGVVRNTRISGRMKNLLASGFMLFAALMLLEAVFMFIPRSHGVGFTLAAKNWFDYYWRVNELGYRDKPVNEIDLRKPRILVLGDSFTAGHGVRYPSETFAGQIRKLASNRFEVLNLGMNGDDSRNEFGRLRDYPHKPDILVLQYYGNDIQKAASEAGITFHGFRPYADLSRLVKYLVRRSYLLNYFYWQFPHTTSSYSDFLKEAYNHPEAMQMHLTDLGMFVEYAESRRIPLLVVIFPFLRAVESSRIFTEPIGDYFGNQGVPVLQVGELLRDVPLSERVVNVNDPHPSVTLHRRVAEEIWTEMIALGWLDSPTDELFE